MYRLIGAYKSQFPTQGFLQPVFQDINTLELYYQVVENNMIENFILQSISPQPDKENFHFAPEFLVYDKTAHAAYVFIDNQGQCICGKLSSIAFFLAEVLYNEGYNPYIKLEVAAALGCYGFINKVYTKKNDHKLDEAEDVSDRDDYLLNIDQTPIIHAEAFFEYISSIRRDYNIGFDDLIAFEKRQAIAGSASALLDETLIMQGGVPLIKQLILNMRHIEQDYLMELIKNKDEIINLFKDEIDNPKNGMDSLNNFTSSILTLLLDNNVVEKRNIEMHLYTYEKRHGLETSVENSFKEELSEMAQMVMLRRAEQTPIPA